MVTSNQVAIVVLSLLLGASNMIGIINAYSYLLSVANANYVLVSILLSGTSFYFLQRNIRLSKLKFSVFLTLCLGVYTSLLSSLLSPIFPVFVQAFAWSVLANFGMGLARWGLGELTTHHLDPVHAKPFFSYIFVFFEIGMLLGLFGMKLPGMNWTPMDLVSAAVAGHALAIFFILIQFVPKRNREVKFCIKTEVPVKLDKTTLKSLTFGIIAVAFTIGAAILCEEHLIRIVLKEELGSYEAIRNMTANYRLVASLIIILIGFAAARFIQRSHLSPILLLSINSMAFVGMAIACLMTQQFYLFIAFEVVKRVLEQTLYAPANSIIYSFFVTALRNRFRSYENFFYYFFPTVPLFIVFLYTPSLGTQNQRLAILVLLLFAALANLLALRRFYPKLVQAMYAFIQSGQKTASILAIQALSFLKPKGFVDFLTDLLRLSPKKLLRKNILLALGHSDAPKALDTIIHEFRKGKEELQLAALDALNTSRTHRGTHFLAQILMEKTKVIGHRVKKKAMKGIVRACGKKAIPLLIQGLYDKNSRVVANILETLNLFRDKRITPFFQEFARSPIPRIRANALLGLARYATTKGDYRKGIGEMLGQRDDRMTPAALYVVGRLRDKGFLPMVVTLHDSTFRSNRESQPPLAWALTQLGDPRGFLLFKDLVKEMYDPALRDGLKHFITMLPRKTRLQLVENLARSFKAHRTFIKLMLRLLKRSDFDFHEEIEHILFIVGESKLFLTVKLEPHRVSPCPAGMIVASSKLSAHKA